MADVPELASPLLEFIRGPIVTHQLRTAALVTKWTASLLDRIAAGVNASEEEVEYHKELCEINADLAGHLYWMTSGHDLECPD